MDITVTPDTYIPMVDDKGNYIDKIPIIRHGIFCPCGSRKDKAYETTSKFGVHIKSKKHKKWIEMMNDNKANYYVEMLKHKEVVENQQKIITQLQNDIQRKLLTIDFLTEQLTRNTITNNISVDLLNIND